MSGATNLSDYRYSVGQALYLFRLGVETESNYLKFVAFWNSLELLVKFLSNARTIRMRIIETTSLYITWKETNNISLVNDCLDNIYSTINKSEKLEFCLNKHRGLKTWKSKRIVSSNILLLLDGFGIIKESLVMI